MNPIGILLDLTTIAICALSLVGCGQQDSNVVAPEPTGTVATADAENPALIAAATPTSAPTASPTATPTPNPTTVTYVYQNINICSDLKSWNSNTTTIKTYATAANSESAYYLFRWDGVFFVATGGCEAGCTANATLTRSDIHGVVCTITVSNGQLTGVTP